jgi:hypothetical protein
VNDITLFTGAALLALITLYGSMNGGNMTFAALFLGLTFISLLLARNTPRRHGYILAAGIPLMLTVGSEVIFIIPVAALVLWLTLLAGGALSTRNEYLLLAGAVALPLPALLLFSPKANAVVLAALLLAAAGTFVSLLALVRLRFVIKMRGDAV